MSKDIALRLFYKEFVEQVKKDPIPDWAATLAFYFMLSIFPLLIFMLALLPYLHIKPNQVYDLIYDHVPAELADLFTQTILQVVSEPKGGLLSFGILATIWSASNGMNALLRALNRAHNIEETRSFIHLRILSIVLTLAMIVVLVVTLLLPIFGRLILDGFRAFIDIPEETFLILNQLRWVIGFVIMTFGLMFIYYIAPNKKLSFRYVMFGALFATLSWQLISLGFSVYVTHFTDYTATYGSLGGVIILMFWFFLSGMILVLGGEINATLHTVRNKIAKNRY